MKQPHFLVSRSACSFPFSFSPTHTQARTRLWNCSYLVWTETLQRIVSKLVSHIHQIIVGVDVVQAVGFCFARGFAHILAVPKETVEVEFVGVLAVRCQAGIAGTHPKPNHHLHSFHTFVSLPKFTSRGAQLKPLFQTWPTDFPQPPSSLVTLLLAPLLQFHQASALS